MSETISLVVWKYYDGSGCGVAAACRTSAAADRLRALLDNQFAGRTYWVEEVEIYDAQ